MKRVSMLEFRKNALDVIRQMQKGQRVVLTYRGEPVARLEPLAPQGVSSDDPVFCLAELADAAAEGMSNRDIDQVVYGD